MKNKFKVSDDGLIATIELERPNGEIVNCVVNRKHGKFYLTVTINGKRAYIGCFATVEEALTAIDSFPAYRAE